MTTPNEIERKILLNAPIERVWQAVADAQQFGAWFRCALDGQFSEGQVITGHSTYEGHEGVKFSIYTKTVREPSYFAIEWCPGPEGAEGDNFEAAEKTLVEFELVSRNNGCELTIRESGFASLSSAHREDYFRSNTEGWAIQEDNIRLFVDQ